MPNRVSQRKKLTNDEWIARIASRADVEPDAAGRLWGAVLCEIADGVKSDANNTFYVPEFGEFAIKPHKGHPLNLGIGCTHVGDYHVFRYKPNPVYKKIVLGDARLSVR